MFAGKTVVVTGGAGGIGRSLVEKFLKEKAIVWVWDRDKVRLAEMVDEAKKFGHELHALLVDISSAEAVQKAVEHTLNLSRRIHIWINNAGVAGLGDFTKMSADEFEKVLDINLRGLVRGTRVALTHMDAVGGGTIVNMASVAGFLPAPYMTAYATSKHAVVGFTRALREELRLRDSAVKLLLVSPGFVDTNMIAPHSDVASFGFPGWLKWMVADPDGVSSAILSALRKGKEEITPTWNGRVMLSMNKILPRTTRRSARLLLTRSFKDLVFRRYVVS